MFQKWDTFEMYTELLSDILLSKEASWNRPTWEDNIKM
jgi:hypothetical protein